MSQSATAVLLAAIRLSPSLDSTTSTSSVDTGWTTPALPHEWFAVQSFLAELRSRVLSEPVDHSFCLGDCDHDELDPEHNPLKPYVKRSLMSTSLKIYPKEVHYNAPESSWYRSPYDPWRPTTSQQPPPPILVAPDAPYPENHRYFRVKCQRCWTQYMACFSWASREPYIKPGISSERQNTEPVISFVHCPNNIDGRCRLTANDQWEDRIRLFNQLKSRIMIDFNRFFWKWYGFNPVLDILGPEEGPQDYEERIRRLYLAWRKVWHLFVLRAETCTIPEPIAELVQQVPTMGPIFRSVQMWGDVVSDYYLYAMKELEKRDIVHLYGVQPDCIQVMLCYPNYWKEERALLNDYAGHRRFMHEHRFRGADRATQRAGAAMVAYMTARKTYLENPTRKNKGLVENAIMTAKTRFREIEGVLFSDSKDDTLVVFN